MLRFAVFCAFVVAIQAQVHLPVSPYADYAPKPYEFGYTSEAIGGSSSHNQVSDGSGTVTGSYTVHDEDGRVRIVEYIADELGFRANVKTNEPGTQTHNSADVTVESDAPVVPFDHQLHHPVSPVARPVVNPAVRTVAAPIDHRYSGLNVPLSSYYY